MVLAPGFSGCRENRLTSVCGSSTIHGRRLLSFACPKESNQRKRHPRIRALGYAEGSLRADGFRPQAILACCRNRRDPSRRPRFARLVRPPFAATQREPEEQKPMDSGFRRNDGVGCVAYIRCFCGRDCRALLCPGPSRPRPERGGKTAKRGAAGGGAPRREEKDRN